MIKVGVIGGAGYTAGELLRLLINHPQVDIRFINSSSNAGKPVADIHEGLIGETDLVFSEEHPLEGIDLLFLCTAHGDSKKFWESNQRPASLKVIDLAQDYRDEREGYVYGLPEVNLVRIKSAASIANPGCFATAIQLSLLPLDVKGLLPAEINITGITGSTGAGVKPSETTHFSWRDNNLSVYKPFTHQHLKEIKMTLGDLNKSFNSEIIFIPVRGDFPRGIYTVTTMHTDLNQEQVVKLYKEFYEPSPFVCVSEKKNDLKQVVNTNKALITLTVNEGKLLVTCAIDNLLKGASGQAVQNMNIMFGLDQTTGLHLKPSGF